MEELLNQFKHRNVLQHKTAGGTTMGTTSSIEAAAEEAEKVMDRIDRKCNCYVASVEHTNSVVDVTLQKLRKEVFELIEPLRSSENITNLSLEETNAILESVELHANRQKLSVQRLLDVLFEAQNTFEEMSDATMGNADVDELPSVPLDEDCMNRMRLVIEDLVLSFERELETKEISRETITLRLNELHRLLFKLAEVTVSEMVESTVSDMKNAFMEDIDNMLCLQMMSGQLKDTLAAKGSLESIISKSMIVRMSLENLPFARRVEIESCQDELGDFVDDIVRKVQMQHCNSEDSPEFEELMNLGLSYESDDSDSQTSVSRNDEHDVLRIEGVKLKGSLKPTSSRTSKEAKTPDKKSSKQKKLDGEKATTERKKSQNKEKTPRKTPGEKKTPRKSSSKSSEKAHSKTKKSSKSTPKNKSPIHSDVDASEATDPDHQADYSPPATRPKRKRKEKTFHDDEVVETTRSRRARRS